VSTQVSPLIPAARVQHLAETAATVRAYHRRTAEQAEAVRRAQHLRGARELLRAHDAEPAADALAEVADAVSRDVEPWARELLEAWPERAAQAAAAEPGVSLAGTRVPRQRCPRHPGPRERVR